MTTTKRKVSVSLDEDLVAELEAGGDALSSQVNDAVRLELTRRRRHRLLGEMLDGLDVDRRRRSMRTWFAGTWACSVEPRPCPRR